MEMEMSNGMVLACTVDDCGWWDNHRCRASQIDVGDMHPSCDTFTTQKMNMNTSEVPPVRNCMVTDCKYHGAGKDCDAPGVSVGYHESHADCDTYVPKM